jgi:2-haloacid dehalogenase
LTRTLDDIQACVFDAYGTLFDFASAAARCADVPEDRRAVLTTLWRDKQLQYAWLRTLENRYADFWQVTGDALDFALESLDLETPSLRERLMDLYLGLEPFPEVPAVLARLREAGFKTAILSNGSPMMLEALVKRSGLEAMFDAILSADAVRAFKTHPDVYQYALRRFISRRGRSLSNPPTPGTRMGRPISACVSSGATAMASAASACRAAPTSRSGRWPDCQRSWAANPPDRAARALGQPSLCNQPRESRAG